MLILLLSLSSSLQYAVPVQPIPYYSYGFSLQVSHGYVGASLLRIGGGGEYSFTSVSAGFRYDYRVFFAGLEGGMNIRHRWDGQEISPGSSFFVGMAFGGRWGFEISWRTYPGKERNLSFLLLGLTYRW